MQAFVRSIQARGGVAEEVILPGQGHFISEEALWQPSLQARMGALGLVIGRSHP
jgi:hypothetical protein